MSITLDGITLDEELIWVDELDWSGIVSTSQRTLLGKQILTETPLIADIGRPVTLGSDNAWISRATLTTIQSMMSELDKVMTLLLNDGTSLQVRFRHYAPPVLDAETVVGGMAHPSSGTWYRLLSLRLVVT